MIDAREDTLGLREETGRTRNKGQDVIFNPFSPAFRTDPYPTYRNLRERAPVKRIMGSWLLSRYSDVAHVLRDRQFSSSRIPDLVKRGRSGVDGSSGYRDHEGIESFIGKAIVFTENPDHSRLRRLVNNIFSPKAVAAERPRIEAIGRRLLERPLAEGGMELIGDFADKLPMYLMCERLGVPWKMGPTIRDWAQDTRLLLDPTLMSKEDYIHVEGVLQSALAYFQQIIEERKRKPGEDVISVLLANRDKEDRLNEREIALTCIMSFVAGHETTKHLIGNGVLALLAHPDQAAKLRAKPALIGNTVEEVLRYNAPLQQTKRIAIKDTTINGSTICNGDQVLLLLGSANHDPAVFADPDRFLIERSNARDHMGFGYGMRACLGGGLAYAEASTAYRLLFCGESAISFATSTLEWQDKSVILRGLHRFPVHLHERGTS